MIGNIGWIVILTAALIWEALAIYHGDTAEWPTLTRLILTHVPMWIIAPALGWLAYHFMLQTKYTVMMRNQPKGDVVGPSPTESAKPPW